MKISPRLVKEKIKDIIEREELTYERFGKSIGVSKNMVSLVLMGKKNLGKETVRRFCSVWEVEIESLLGEEEKFVFRIEEFLSQVIRLKKINNDELVEKTGIDLLVLSQIKRGVRQATQEELQKICEVLGIDYSMVEQKKIAQGLHIIEDQMKQLCFTDEVIDKVMGLLNDELKNRRYI